MALVVAAVVATSLALWVRDDDPESALRRLHENQQAWVQVSQEVSVDRGRRYSDEELGLYGLIDNVIFSTPFYVRFRVADDALNSSLARDQRIADVAVGHERERLAFERDIEDVVRSAYGFLPSDLGVGGALEMAFVEAMESCAAEAGYPAINPMGAPEEERARYQAEFGLTSDAFYDLRHDCAIRAAAYPTLEPDVRDEMIERIRTHYLQAVHEYLRQPDVAEIPIEHRDGVVHPIEMSHIQYCLDLKPSERGWCAETYRVELTEAQMAAPAPEQDVEDETAPYPLVGQPCDFLDIPGLVTIGREGRPCDMFENLEFIINYPETDESKARVFNLYNGGLRLLNCPNDWLIDDEGKCRYPRPEEAALREAWLKAHPEEESLYGLTLHSSLYPDKN